MLRAQREGIALTGARAKVGNYPGVTVTRRSSTLDLTDGEVELVDLPGTYSLAARSREEQVAADALLGRESQRPDAVLVVADATALARNLYRTMPLPGERQKPGGHVSLHPDRLRASGSVTPWFLMLSPSVPWSRSRAPGCW